VAQRDEGAGRLITAQVGLGGRCPGAGAGGWGLTKVGSGWQADAF
jgi:hypothetical protein